MNLFNIFAYIQMRKKRQEEQAMPISGWQNQDENDTQRDFCLERPKKQMTTLQKSSSTPLQKLPFREQNMNRTKKLHRWYQREISNLKKDKQLLQKYLYSEKDFKPDIQHQIQSYQQQNNVAINKCHIQIAVRHSKHKYRLTQAQERIRPLVEQPFKFLQKYTLFSGIKNEANKKRRMLLRTDSKQNMSRQKLNTDLLWNNPLISSKYYYKQASKSKDQRYPVDQTQKKKMTFPMYFRQLLLKQQKIRKQKQSQTMNVQPSKKLKYCAEFMDDNMFSTKRIRQ